MTFFNYFSQFNMNSWSGFNNMFTQQWSPMPMQTFIQPMFNFTSFNFAMPKLNFGSIWNNNSAQINLNPISQNSNLSNWSSQPIKLNSCFTASKNSNLDSFIKSTGTSFSNFTSIGYNAQKGQKLAQQALNRASGFNGHCAKAVKTAIQNSGLGKYESGHAYQMTNILKSNPNFKQISANTDVNSLPAGCVLVFNKGSQNYSSEYGHTEITTGTKKGVSDGITNRLKQPDAIFIPV